MTYDGHFQDGFDGYGPSGFYPVVAGAPKPDFSAFLLGKWTGIVFAGLSSSPDVVSCQVQDSLLGPGQSLRVLHTFNASGQSGGISKTLDDSYEGIRFAMVFRTELTAKRKGFVFADTGIGQVAITVETSGNIGVRRDGISGTLVAMSAASVSSFEANTLAGRVTFDADVGQVKLYLNGRVILDVSVPTQATVEADRSDTVNQFQIWAANNNNDLQDSWIDVDHLYVDGYASALDLEDPIPTLPMIETQFGDADYAVDFTFGAALLGPDYSATTTENAPGANQLVLRRYTPPADGDLATVSILPGATSLTAKFKGVAYSDAAGVPDALLDEGPEVVACTDGEDLDLDLTSPVALSAGAPVWIGFLTDTSVSLKLTDTEALEGYKAARTYGLGAPGAAPAMTPLQASWVIYGHVDGLVDNFWSVVDQNPVSPIRSYMTSATPGDQLLLEFPNLSSTPTTIYGVEVGAVIWRFDSGARTIDLISKSGPTTGSGDNPGQTPATNPSSIWSFFALDPDTAAAWNASGLNLSRHGLEIAT